MKKFNLINSSERVTIERIFRQGDPDTGLSVGDVLRTDLSMSLKQVFEIADNKMYQDKISHKNFHIVTKQRNSHT